MRRSLAIAANRSPLGLGAVLVLTVTLLGLTFPAPVAAELLDYTTNTSAPEGHAVCSFKGTIKKSFGSQLGVTLNADQGEARLDLTLRYPDALGLTVVDRQLAAGIQPGCDIFPNTPAFDLLPFKTPTEVVGILDIHAHPGSDCYPPLRVGEPWAYWMPNLLARSATVTRRTPTCISRPPSSRWRRRARS